MKVDKLECVLREVVHSLPLRIFKLQLHKPLSNLLYFEQEVGLEDSRNPFLTGITAC